MHWIARHICTVVLRLSHWGSTCNARNRLQVVGGIRAKTVLQRIGRRGDGLLGLIRVVWIVTRHAVITRSIFLCQILTIQRVLLRRVMMVMWMDQIAPFQRVSIAADARHFFRLERVQQLVSCCVKIVLLIILCHRLCRIPKESFLSRSTQGSAAVDRRWVTWWQWWTRSAGWQQWLWCAVDTRR